MRELIKFGGNCPKNVNKDAKYAIRSASGRAVVALTYLTNDGEQWLATSAEHPELVEMVNAVKTSAGSAPNGPFYINEYGQVIVPVQDGDYYLAGEYDGLLEFEFEGTIISGNGVGAGTHGRLPQAGDEWSGPHPGIPYVLKAGGGDVYFDTEPRPNVKKRLTLSAVVGAEAATAFARRVQSVKGWSGGRFYVNEWRELFAPVGDGGQLKYVYIGNLDLDEPWFPKWQPTIAE